MGIPEDALVKKDVVNWTSSGKSRPLLGVGGGIKRDKVIPNIVFLTEFSLSQWRMVRDIIGSVPDSSSGQGISFLRLMVQTNESDFLIQRAACHFILSASFTKKRKYSLMLN